MKIFLLTGLSLLLFSGTALAYTGDMSINGQNIRFSNNSFMEGRTARIYATVSNQSDKDLLGVVRFFDNNNQVGGDQAISIFANKTDDIFVDWNPSFGSHRIAVKIYPWDPEIDDPSNNWIVTEVYAVQDTDHDGITNSEDPDDDGDGVNDEEDAFPLNAQEQYDTDGDSIGDNADPDDDNDGVPDEFDDMPLDPNETMDTDKDGIGNIADTDDDGDGLSDSEEENLKTDPINSDSDSDGVNDGADPFPLNSEEWTDTDNDNIGNNSDTDDDNDGILDENDEFPLNKGPVIKLKDDNSTVGVMDTVTFDASPSYDDDGQVVSYIWEIDGEAQEGNSVKYIFKKNGDHKVKLTITDDQGEKKSAEFLISVMNLKLYTQLAITLFALLLEILIYFKYISRAKNSTDKRNSK